MEKASFLNQSRPLLTVMMQCKTPETAIGRIRNALCQGGEAFGLQVESLKPEYHDPEVYKRLFGEMRGRPSYVTNYRSCENTGKTDEELARGLVTLAESGATLCDLMGDLFCKHPEELTDDEAYRLIAVRYELELRSIDNMPLDNYVLAEDVELEWAEEDFACMRKRQCGEIE